MRQGIDSPDGSWHPLPLAEAFRVIRRQITESVDRIDEYRGILHIRRHLAASPIFKGIAGFRPTRIAMLRANTLAELMDILDDIQRHLDTGEPFGNPEQSDVSELADNNS